MTAQELLDMAKKEVIMEQFETYIPIQRGRYALLTISPSKPRVLYDNKNHPNYATATNEYIVVVFASVRQRTAARRIARTHECRLWEVNASRLSKDEKKNAKQAVTLQLFDDWLWNDEHKAVLFSSDDSLMAIPANYRPVGTHKH